MERYRVEILDNTLTPITQLKSFVLLNSGKYLQYGERLSLYRSASFRVGTKDPMYDKLGDIFQPYQYHVRIYRSNVLVWSGIIVDNPHRTSSYIEVKAYTYLFLLTKTQIRHDAADGNGAENFRTINSGTLASVVQTLLTEAKADYPSLARITIGALENPDFPPGFKDSQGNDLTGTWTFSQFFQIKFDYRDVFYAIQSLAIYGACDFDLDENLVFNFKKFLGNKQENLLFEFTNAGSIADYDAPLDGTGMVNDLIGLAADNNYNILKVEQMDNTSITSSGKLSGVAAYNDVKEVNLLSQRTMEDLNFNSTPDTSLSLLLNERAYPLGTYGNGDIVTVRINDKLVQVNDPRRIVGYDVLVDITGTESIELYTNKPREDQL